MGTNWVNKKVTARRTPTKLYAYSLICMLRDAEVWSAINSFCRVSSRSVCEQGLDFKSFWLANRWRSREWSKLVVKPLSLVSQFKSFSFESDITHFGAVVFFFRFCLKLLVSFITRIIYIFIASATWVRHPEIQRLAAHLFSEKAVYFRGEIKRTIRISFKLMKETHHLINPCFVLEDSCSVANTLEIYWYSVGFMFVSASYWQ